MIMEPLVYLSVTATTLTRHLAYLRQAMAMLHVVYASISILLDMGGAGLIRDLGGIIGTYLVNGHPTSLAPLRRLLLLSTVCVCVCEIGVVAKLAKLKKKFFFREHPSD